MKYASEKFYGVSEAFNHVLEWKKSNMIKKNVCPSLRATDYKCPKYVWYEICD